MTPDQKKVILASAVLITVYSIGFSNGRNHSFKRTGKRLTDESLRYLAAIDIVKGKNHP